MTTADVANQARIDRAELRLRIGAGEVRASSVLADMPDCIKGCGAYTFLTFLPQEGKRTGAHSSRAFVLLRKSNTTSAGHRRLDQLTAGQLDRLTRVVRDYEDNRHPAERGLA